MGLGVGREVYLWGVQLNSRNLNYSALGLAIDFLLDRLTESGALGQRHALAFAGRDLYERLDGWESVRGAGGKKRCRSMGGQEGVIKDSTYQDCDRWRCHSS